MVRCLQRGVGMLALAWAGCASPLPPARIEAPPTAEVVVSNETPYAWRLEFARIGTEDRQVAEIRPRATQSVRLSRAGGYRVGQTIVTPGVEIPARTVDVEFELGEHYVWRLATLLTSSEHAGGTP